MRPLAVALLGAGCAGITDPDSPPGIEGVEVSCQSGRLDVSVVASDANAVTNVVLAAEEAVWYPLRDLSMSSTLSAWRLVDQAHDCGQDLLIEVTVTNLLGLQASGQASWPEVELDPGVVTPVHGSDAGGTVVHIAGSGLEAVEAVQFGEVDAVPTAADADGLTVTTPAGSPGLVDVTLLAGASETVLEGAFTYYPDASGLVRGELLPSLSALETSYINISSAYASTTDDFIQFEMVFYADPLPWESTYLGAWPTGGDCEWGSFLGGWTDVGTYLLIDGAPTGELPALPTDSNVYYVVDDGLTLSEWTGQRWSLEIPDGTAELPPMRIEEALQLPMAPVDPSFDFEASNTTSWGEDITISWDPASGYDGMDFTLFPSQGTSALGTYSCSGDAPRGEVSVSWEDLTAGIDEAQVNTIYASLTFWIDNELVLPHDNSILASRGQLTYWVYFSLE